MVWIILGVIGVGVLLMLWGLATAAVHPNDDLVGLYVMPGLLVLSLGVIALGFWVYWLVGILFVLLFAVGIYCLVAAPF